MWFSIRRPVRYLRRVTPHEIHEIQSWYDASKTSKVGYKLKDDWQRPGLIDPQRQHEESYTWSEGRRSAPATKIPEMPSPWHSCKADSEYSQKSINAVHKVRYLCFTYKFQYKRHPPVHLGDCISRSLEFFFVNTGRTYDKKKEGEYSINIAFLELILFILSIFFVFWVVYLHYSKIWL